MARTRYIKELIELEFIYRMNGARKVKHFPVSGKNDKEREACLAAAQLKIMEYMKMPGIEYLASAFKWRN